jgi:aldose 1-epimerase
MIVLERGAVSCTLDPALGGSLLSLSVAGVDVLRRTPPAPLGVFDVACFPLVPFANRIAHGKIIMNGREVALPADAAAPPHAHHGHGWRHPWRLVERIEDSAVLEYRHAADQWPWSYVATQRIALVDGGAEIGLSVTNLSGDHMPAGLGLHPYFARSEADAIETRALRMVLNGSDGIPIDEASIDPGEKPIVALEGLDNLLLDKSGHARLQLGGVRCDMNATGAIGFHVYIPEHENFFCVEPVSHRPNAFASNAERYAIKPGETRGLKMRLTVAL